MFSFLSGASGPSASSWVSPFFIPSLKWYQIRSSDMDIRFKKKIQDPVFRQNNSAAVQHTGFALCVDRLTADMLVFKSVFLYSSQLQRQLASECRSNRQVIAGHATSGYCASRAILTSYRHRTAAFWLDRQCPVELKSTQRHLFSQTKSDM